MVGNHHFTRVDTQELKDHMYRKIGRERSEKYFHYLNRFLCFKLSKSEFDKCCLRTIGRENISLHNQLVRSILQNACQAKVPPQKARKVEGLDVKVANGYQRNYLQSLYGDSFPQSPRKCMSPVSRDRKFRDRPSPLGPLGKSPSLTCEETVTRVQEQRSATELHSLSSRPKGVEDGEEVEQFARSPNVRSFSPITAPYGVSFNVGGARKALHPVFKTGDFARTCHCNGELPDMISLRSRLQQKLACEGIGISMDCANLINSSVDVYLKRLIEPILGISGSRFTDPRIFGSRGQLNNQKISALNGALSQRFAQSIAQPIHGNMLDFRVAMESNPFILGKDWPIQLEKICNYSMS